MDFSARIYSSAQSVQHFLLVLHKLRLLTVQRTCNSLAKASCGVEQRCRICRSYQRRNRCAL